MVGNMFKNLQRELEKLSRLTEVSVPIERDPEGFLDKECPSETCHFLFKIHGDDWSNIVRDEEVFCPSCRHAAPAKSWYTRTQVDEAKKYALATVTNAVNKAMRADANESKRRQNRCAFVSPAKAGAANFSFGARPMYGLGGERPSPSRVSFRTMLHCVTASRPSWMRSSRRIRQCFCRSLARSMTRP